MGTYLKTADLILLLFRDDSIQSVIDLFYPTFISNRIESSKLIFVESAVEDENRCKLTERQKGLLLEKFKQFDEDYIQKIVIPNIIWIH